MCVLGVTNCIYVLFFFFFKQKTAYEMRISDWSSDVCSSDLLFGLDYRDIAPLYEALLAEMEQPETVAGINFGMAFLDSQRDYPPEDVNGIGPVYRISADMMCWWHPA